MKTTVVLPDALAQAAKQAAREDQTTLRELLEAGLRLILARRQESKKFSLADASVDGNGINPDFRQAGWEKMRDAIYGDFA